MDRRCWRLADMHGRFLFILQCSAAARCGHRESSEFRRLSRRRPEERKKSPSALLIGSIGGAGGLPPCTADSFLCLMWRSHIERQMEVSPAQRLPPLAIVMLIGVFLPLSYKPAWRCLGFITRHGHDLFNN